MTTPAKPDVCPKCGTGLMPGMGRTFQCGSLAAIPDTTIRFEQTTSCRIAELEAALARVTADRD